MNVLALIGSPRKAGNTDLLCDEFLRGAGERDAQCEKVYLDDLLIRPAAELGDVQRERVDLRADDDCRAVVDKLLAADIVVLGSPVYWQGLPAQLKCFVDRFSCHYAQPWFNEGMRGKGWIVIVPYGASDPAEAKWVTEPIKVWVGHFKGTYLGAVAVSVFRKGAVSEMPEVLRETYELGKRSVEAMEGQSSQR